MAETFFKEAPKFETPEEELDFLRKEVAKKERELAPSGSGEDAKEDAVKGVIQEYKKIPIGEVLNKDNIVKESEHEGIVLKLKPETHDSVMEELLGFLITKGIKNTLTLVEKMGNPHIDDDFHRILIQYLKADGNFKVNEGTPFYKSLSMTLFEITLPPPEEEGDKQKGFKEFIGAMEQFYAGMQSISEGRNNDKEVYFTLEVALSSESDEVVVYAGIPNKHISLFEKQVLAFYHDAKVREAQNDYNIFNNSGGSAGAYAMLSEHERLRQNRACRRRRRDTAGGCAGWEQIYRPVS